MEQSSSNDAERFDWAWLSGEIRTEAKAFAAQLRLIASDSVPGNAAIDTTSSVPNLDWSVRELAAHVVCLPALYRTLNSNTQSMAKPDDFTEFSREARAHLDHLSLAELADELDRETESLLRDLGDGTASWMLYVETTSANVGAGFLGELLLHGQDLGALTGAPPTIEAGHARAWVAASMVLAPYFADPAVALKCAGTYHLKFRDGEHYTMQVSDGQLTTTPGRIGRPDAILSADPKAYMLVSMGRMSENRAALTGKLIAYGRKPWKLIRLGKIKIDGV